MPGPPENCWACGLPGSGYVGQRAGAYVCRDCDVMWVDPDVYWIESDDGGISYKKYREFERAKLAAYKKKYGVDPLEFTPDNNPAHP
jgi:hypothetical protein